MALTTKPSNLLIDWAFDNGYAQGDRNYWKALPASSAEWSYFVNAVRGPLLSYAFSSGLAAGDINYWMGLSASSHEWSDIFRVTNTMGGGGGNIGVPPDTPPVAPPTAPPDDIPPVTPPEDPGGPPPLDFFTQASLMFPWLPAALVQIYANKWTELGIADPAIIMAAVRQDPLYETYFPGNKRGDGTLRLSEIEYLSTIAGYENILFGAGVNPSVFQGQFSALIGGNVSVNEFATRVHAMESRIIEREAELSQIYSQFYGVAMDRASLLAAAIDPGVGQQVIERKITIAEIGGEAALQQFAISRDRATELFQAGVSQSQARQVFQQAGQFVPTLQRAGQRQSEGAFGLDPFLDVTVFSDPLERRRLDRILAGEQSMFTGTRTAARRQEDTGAVTGIRPR